MRIQIIISIVSILSFIKSEKGKDRGAYKGTPDSSNLQFRFGNNLGYWSSKWDDSKMSYLSSLAGTNGQRKKLPEKHLDYWGYGIEIDDAKHNNEYGIFDVVGYLCTPTDEHSSLADKNPELCYPKNLYEPIWLSNGLVNPKNYWASYVNQTVTLYKQYIKIWEVWNEPDYTNNYGAVGNWMTSPPNPKDLVHWFGSIFEYIRLLRITYEVAKKADPTCWVATGGLGYPEFLDGILRYTDEPTKGEVTDAYPAYGGAYFDCDSYHQYPQYGVNDLETGEGYHDNGSDMLAKKVVMLKKNHEYIIKKHGFGSKYPKKIYIVTETGVNSGKVQGKVGGDLERRNWLIKVTLFALEYDVKQIHLINLADDGNGMGDFSNLGSEFTSFDAALKNLKSSSKARLTMQKFHIGKFVFDQEKSKKFRESLPNNTTGIVLKRKFSKSENETDNYDYVYSVWRTCLKEEVQGEVDYKLDLPVKEVVLMDWQGNEKKIDVNSQVKISSTPIFLLANGDSGMSGVAIFFVTLLCIIIIGGLAFGGFFFYKRWRQKNSVSIDNKSTPIMN